MWDLKTKLRIEKSEYCSGKLLNESSIPILKDRNYLVKEYSLDGDAPKQFIKAYIYEEDGTVRKLNRKTWHSYIAKTAEKWYPHESLIEFMLNRIGQVLNIRMNETKLTKANTQIRFLSKYFLKNNEQLIHGADICGQHLEDMALAKQIADHAPTARELFTFEFIEEAIREVFPTAHASILADLVKMLTFDVITGNNDRHFYNWGVISTKKKTQKLPTFSPIFDSARGLLWNWSDENIIEQLTLMPKGGKKIEKYIIKASPRISIEEKKDANHFELLSFVKNKSKTYKAIVDNLTCEKIENQILKMLNKEFYPFFIPERRELVTYILNHRFKKIRSSV